MPQIALMCGVLLLAVGLYGYFGPELKNSAKAASTASPPSEPAETTSGPSKTALIPALFGLPLMICGTLGFDRRCRKNAMHAAAGVAALGAVMATIRFLTVLPKWMSTAPDVNAKAFFSVGVMALLCWVFVVVATSSFLAARRVRLAAASPSSAPTA